VCLNVRRITFRMGIAVSLRVRTLNMGLNVSNVKKDALNVLIIDIV